MIRQHAIEKPGWHGLCSDKYMTKCSSISFAYIFDAVL